MKLVAVVFVLFIFHYCSSIENYYEVLGLNPEEATDETVKKAYRRLAMKFHPDKGGDPDHFILLTRAYESLKTPNLREYYSLTLEYDYSIHDSFYGSQNTTPYHYSNLDFDLHVLQNVFYVIGFIFTIVFVVRFCYFQRRKETVKKLKVCSKKRIVRRANSFNSLFLKRRSSREARLSNLRKAVLYRKLLLKCRQIQYRS